MFKPFFSILIPVYGNTDYLDSCLKSIVEQDFDNFEIIICWQGNNDYRSSIEDERIRVIYLEKPSSYVARVTSYNESKGEYVLFIDSDDELLNGALNKLYNLILKYHNVDIIQFGYTSNKKENIKAHIKQDQHILTKNEYLSYFLSELGTYPIWRKCFKNNKICFYEEDIFLADDALLTLAFIENSKEILSIDDKLYYYRLNNKSGTVNIKPKYLNDLAVFINRSFKYRNTKTEIEMAIYSFINTFFIYSFAFPKYDFIENNETKIVVNKIIAFDFDTNPGFIKKNFLKIVNERKYASPFIFKYFFKIMKRLKINFRVELKNWKDE